MLAPHMTSLREQGAPTPTPNLRPLGKGTYKTQPQAPRCGPGRGLVSSGSSWRGTGLLLNHSPWLREGER